MLRSGDRGSVCPAQAVSWAQPAGGAEAMSCAAASAALAALHRWLSRHSLSAGDPAAAHSGAGLHARALWCAQASHC